MNTYTVYRRCLNNKLTCKEHLNNMDEVNEWIASKYGKYASLFVVCDQTKKAYLLTDNGLSYDKILMEYDEQNQ